MKLAVLGLTSAVIVLVIREYLLSRTILRLARRHVRNDFIYGRHGKERWRR